MASVALAREAAVPWSSRDDVEVGRGVVVVFFAGLLVSLGAGLGLAEPIRAEDPLTRRLDVPFWPFGKEPLGVRDFARLDAVGLTGSTLR